MALVVLVHSVMACKQSIQFQIETISPALSLLKLSLSTNFILQESIYSIKMPKCSKLDVKLCFIFCVMLTNAVFFFPFPFFLIFLVNMRLCQSWTMNILKYAVLCPTCFNVQTFTVKIWLPCSIKLNNKLCCHTWKGQVLKTPILISFVKCSLFSVKSYASFIYDILSFNVTKLFFLGLLDMVCFLEHIRQVITFVQLLSKCSLLNLNF